MRTGTRYKHYLGINTHKTLSRPYSDVILLVGNVIYWDYGHVPLRNLFCCCCFPVWLLCVCLHLSLSPPPLTFCLPDLSRPVSLSLYLVVRPLSLPLPLHLSLHPLFLPSPVTESHRHTGIHLIGPSHEVNSEH